MCWSHLRERDRWLQSHESKLGLYLIDDMINVDENNEINEIDEVRVIILVNIILRLMPPPQVAMKCCGDDVWRLTVKKCD